MNLWKDKKILITGHTGFKGSWLSLVLKSFDAKLYGLSKSSKAGIYEDLNLSNIFEKEEFLDIHKNPEKLEMFLQRINPEIVFHLAAQSLVPYAYHNPKETYETNIIGTYNVLQKSNTIESIKVIVVSTTDKVYLNSEKWNSEGDELGGREPYSTSKVATEFIIDDFKNIFSRKDLNISIVRSGNVIGGGDRAEKRLLNDLIYSIINQKTMHIRNPNGIRPWQDILDSVSGYMKVGEYTYQKNVSEIFNLNSKPNNEYTVEKIINDFVNIWGSEIDLIVNEEKNLNESEILRLDSTKAEKILNWSPKISLEESLSNIVKWEKDNIDNKAMETSLEQIQSYFCN